jgi:hypothetical protein
MAIVLFPWSRPGAEGCGVDERTGELFSGMDLETRVRADHPIRLLRPAPQRLRHAPDFRYGLAMPESRFH